MIVPAIAAGMLALTLTPAGVWHAPAVDAVYNGFDSNLLYTSVAGKGSAAVSKTQVDLTAATGSLATANLATTLMPKLDAAVDVTVMENSTGADAFRIGFWSPWTESGRFLAFGPAPSNAVVVETVVGGDNGPILRNGTVRDSTVLGHYRLASSYRLVLLLDKSSGAIVTTVSGDDGTQWRSSSSTDIFGNVQVSLTASSAGQGGPSHAVLSNYSLSLPHQRFWASKIDDNLARGLELALALLGGVLLAIKLVLGFRRRLMPAFAARMSAFAPRGSSGQLVVLLAIALSVYLIGNVALFPLGGHPFDMADEKLYAYVGVVYGPAQLYFLPSVSSIASIWNGVPFVEAAFPYEPVSAYLHTAIGWLSLWSNGSLTPSSVSVEYLTKAINVAFGLADGALIYLILRQIGTSERWSVAGSALFLFNPAVWFSMSVWGQTHVMSLFFVLAAMLLAERSLVTPAWLSLAAACLTRPQMLVFGLLLGIVFARKFGLRSTLMALSWTVIAVFIAILPLTLATSPSLPLDVMLHNFNVQEAGGNVSILTTVSQDAYSIWPLVTYATRGASSMMRVITPSSESLVGSITYQLAGQILTIGSILILAAVLAVSKRFTERAAAYLPVIALGIASFLMLLTGIVATHFLLALPFFLLIRRWIGSTPYFYVAIIWTITTFIPMYGDMGAATSGLGYPLFGPDHNALTKWVVELYQWDRFITVGIVANICALIWVGYLTFRSYPSRPEVPGA